MDYLDTSAFVKLVLAEPESVALRAALAGSEGLVSSALLVVEARRAATRYEASAVARTAALLRTVSLLPIGDDCLEAAASVQPPSVRSLDAIHLATALSVGRDLGRLYCYDARLGEAAVAAGLTVSAPA